MLISTNEILMEQTHIKVGSIERAKKTMYTTTTNTIMIKRTRMRGIFLINFNSGKEHASLVIGGQEMLILTFFFGCHHRRKMEIEIL
jgi:hypothetical protein